MNTGRLAAILLIFALVSNLSILLIDLRGQAAFERRVEERIFEFHHRLESAEWALADVIAIEHERDEALQDADEDIREVLVQCIRMMEARGAVFTMAQ